MSERGIRAIYYKSRRPIGRQKWRFKIVDAHNGKKLASSGEAYVNRSDCVDTLVKVVGYDTLLEIEG